MEVILKTLYNTISHSESDNIGKQGILQGQMLIDLLLVIGLSTLIFPALAIGFVNVLQGKAQQTQRLQAVTLLKATQEEVKSIRNSDWTTFANLSGQGALHPLISGSSWTAASGAYTSNSLTQQFVVSEVYRDSNGSIVTTRGSDDPSTKQITITISWVLPYASSITSTFYLTRTANLVYTDTTVSDFNKGTYTGTAVAATSGTQITNDGQVQLGAGGSGGDWCKPQNAVLSTFDLPGQGVVQAISATSSATRYAYAYTTTGGNSSGDAVDGLTIDNYPNPPSVANPSSNTEAKAYGIFVDNNNSYVYFNENNTPNHTVRIARTNDLSDVGYFDVSHTTGQSIFVLGTTGYTTAQSTNTMYSFDVSTIKGTSSQTQLGSVNLVGTGIGQRVVVVGTNAYVASSDSTHQLQIINVSNPSNMSVTKTINLGNGQGAVDVFVNSSQTYAYVVTSYISGQNDFFIVDLTNTNNIYGYSTNGMSPNALAIVSGNRAIVVGQGGILYQVFNIANPASASYCGGMSPTGATSIKAIAPIYQGGLAYSYILTDNASAEFQIILGGAGGQYSAAGTYESGTFDAGYSVAFNRFVADVAEPAATSISAQVAIAPSVNNSCSGVSSFTYVGPGGTSGSNDRYTVNGNQITGLIPLSTVSPNYQNPQRCFRYKFYLSSTDQTQSPELYDMNMNYSP